jgi:phytoene synthase
VAAGPSLAAAYDACARLARAHYENFPVASLLLPRTMRPHVAALYAFARTADDFADEGAISAGERHRLLDDWLSRLHRSVSPGEAEASPDVRDRRATLQGRQREERENLDAGRDPGATAPADFHDQIFEALARTIRECRLPVVLFEDLLSAFRQDVDKKRYGTWDEVLDYCRRSANPVGRLVLRIAGYEDADLDRASDALCTALQLANFWQDLERDWLRGRLYLPLDDLEACGARERTLDERRLTPEWRAAMQRVADRTRSLFERGRPVCDGVSGRLRFELRATWLGGIAILNRLEASGFDVFTNRPSLGKRDFGPILLGALCWRMIRGERLGD